MSQFRIVHKTGYRYPGGATASFNEARMTPLTSHRQLVLSTRLDIGPVAWRHSYRDYWGTSTVAFEVHEPHEQMEVVATSTVDIHEVERAQTSLDWADLADPKLVDVLNEYLQQTRYVAPHEQVAVLARRVRARAARPADAVTDIVNQLRQRVEYVSGVTEVHTPASEVWDASAGVCQDLAHLTIGALRTIGIPTRYISGYVIARREPEIGEAMVGESHAWVQYWDGEWVGIDPTTQTEPRASHVEVAAGRDYGDVPPLRGIYTGTGGSDMFVSVEMTRLT
ncbi:MAG: transglutaminase domain-containing protein [Arachnia sp.]